MLCQRYTSALIPHRTVSQAVADREPHLVPSAVYNADILGDDSFECIDRADGVYFAAGSGALADSGTVVVTGWTRQRWLPGWGRHRWEFDAETGAFVRRGEAPGGFYAQDVYQGAGGELWLKLIVGQLQLLGPDYQPTGVELSPETFGATAFTALFIDRMRNRIVMTPGVDSVIEVRALDTGSLLHSVITPSRPRDICHEEGSRCYVLTDSRDVLLLDYMTARWMGAVKLTGISGANARIGWDKRYRRLVAIEQPVAPLGYANQIGLAGFALRPVATHLCAPIPLKRLRAGLQVHVLIKAIGDMGEGIPEGVSVGVAGPVLAAPRNIVALDGAGEGVAVLDALTAGSDTVNLSLDVPCQP